MAGQSHLPISQVSDDSTEEVASNANSFRAAKLAAVGLTLLIAGSALVLQPGRDSRGAVLDLATNKALMPDDYSEFSERFGTLLAGKSWDQIAEIKDCIHGNACPDIGTEQDEMGALRSWYTTASVTDRTAHESQTEQMMNGQSAIAAPVEQTPDAPAEWEDGTCPEKYPKCHPDFDCVISAAAETSPREWTAAPTAETEPAGKYNYILGYDADGAKCTGDFVQEQGTCSNDGDNCNVTKCCTSPGSFCFKKNDEWASCNQTCNEKMLWNHDKQVFEEQATKVWECTKLSCTENGENCMASACCIGEAPIQCFKKNEEWASCNQTCNEKMLWNFEKQIFEEQLVKVWDCSVLSEPISPPAKPVCTANGENCLTAKCCLEPGMTCFKKNEEWASCNQTCNEKMLWNHDKQQFEEQATKVWDCSSLSAKPTCSHDGDGTCKDTQCCENPGSFCFKKNDEWAACNQTCNEKMVWNHATLAWDESATKVWDCLKLSCTANGENCMASQCCLEPGMKCFKKNEEWASCNETCNEKMLWNEELQKFEEQATKVWDCAVLEAKMPNTTADEVTPADPCFEAGEITCENCTAGDECTNCKEKEQRNCCIDLACASEPGLAACTTPAKKTCCDKYGKTGACMFYT